LCLTCSRDLPHVVDEGTDLQNLTFGQQTLMKFDFEFLMRFSQLLHRFWCLKNVLQIYVFVLSRLRFVFKFNHFGRSCLRPIDTKRPNFESKIDELVLSFGFYEELPESIRTLLKI
jgi:hypothetical protein